jgi:hypothetical protein
LLLNNRARDDLQLRRDRLQSFHALLVLASRIRPGVAELDVVVAVMGAGVGEHSHRLIDCMVGILELSEQLIT